MFEELLRAKLAGICELSDERLCRLREHYELLSRWNKVLNLTAIRTMEEAVERHYCESLFVASHLPESAASVADAGSGGGFPGIPIAIVRPDCAVALIEAHQRKAVFLREASRGLPNVHVIAKRIDQVREQFEWVVMRAVRFSEVAASLKKLGRAAEILTGEVRPSDLPGFEWEPPIRLPWGENRYLWIGVSRETGS